MGIDFFQVLAVVRERGGYGVARTRAFEQNDMRKRLCVIVSLIVHDTSIGPRPLTANTEKAGKSPILPIRKKRVMGRTPYKDVQGTLRLSKGF
ncbi:MAG TPA: hypothetical protein VGK36_21445 [Candidatus Angelobacter sp.]